MKFLKGLFVLIRLLCLRLAALIAENLALRRQPEVLQRSAERPRLRRRDRVG